MRDTASALRDEFFGFLKEYKIVGLAIAFVMGAATTKLVNSLVNGIVMPVIGLALPSGSWREAKLVLSESVDAQGNTVMNAIRYGEVLATLIEFMVVALVVFFFAKMVLREETVTKK
jgi:large conductance mechanosensitive channel